MDDIFSVKGHQIKLKTTKFGADRKAVLFANNIIEELGKIGIIRDDVEIKTNILGSKNIPAKIEFWGHGHYMRFTYSKTNRFIDNLYIISELIRLEVEEVLEGKKELTQFLQTFSEDGNRKELGKELKEAKKTLGLDEEETNIEKINLAYKKLAKLHHPDIGGDLDEFKKINKAHKLIKKELGV